MAVQEAVSHGVSHMTLNNTILMRVLIGLLKPYDIVQTAPGTLVAEFFFTSTPFFIIILLPCAKLNDRSVALLPAGPLLLSPTPAWYSA